MRKRVGLILATMALLTGTMLTGPVRATVVRSMELAEIVSLSDTIVLGTVVDTRSEWNAEQTVIHTYVSVAVEEAWQGDSADVDLTLRILGGMVGDHVLSVPGLPSFSPGDRLVLFVEKVDAEYLAPVGLFQGVYFVSYDVEVGVDRARRASGSGSEMLESGRMRKDAPVDLGPPVELSELKTKVYEVFDANLEGGLKR